jgi:hypothetical protein
MVSAGGSAEGLLLLDFLPAEQLWSSTHASMFHAGEAGLQHARVSGQPAAGRPANYAVRE